MPMIPINPITLSFIRIRIIVESEIMEFEINT